ncbi:TorD/DmsD family molecular chaperone [Crenalkalicoccus roseus]|uniref:TorD/DmsD family molecular chaperone n=1 Tax=Crenalkalicoccus roseus TaxID=1485588 RepID=UPI0010805B7D|nr:molecular chaperone TorD family protein [Crenalkalicoccus roseus]
MGCAAEESLDLERARLFALLARLLAEAPDVALLGRLRRLAGEEGTPLGRALAALADAAARAEPGALEREYFDLFIGLGRGELLPYASYYLTGFLHERPLAELRGDLARLGVARAAGVAEPEDHIAFLCETLAGLLEGRLGPGAEAAGPFFARHLRPWAGRFFADLEAAEAARFYRAVGTLGRVTIEIEQAAAELPEE